METCDRCGPSVAAQYRVFLPSGGDLWFCAHHAREHYPAFQQVAVRMIRVGDLTAHHYAGV